ncbi:homoserine kinase [Erythrobacter sp. HKB08]|uniref:homoserine kinase n=1 Tax=Erythrobacter sp. HKB08 TaxID=2502843 RepID=UPI00100895BB|nr:homoserine kinase [Erythrobacter sp. HKB08]
MAVYTHLSADTLEKLIAAYDVGELRSAKGIAEGVSNSNWLVETSEGRFILTMYERRIELDELPYFLGLLDHLAAKDCPVPRTIHDREGAAFRMIDGKAVALIEFLPGVSVDRASEAEARSVGAALASIHSASEDFAPRRKNDLRPSDWQALFDQCGEDGLAGIHPDLPAVVERHLPDVMANWPEHLPQATIHADLFPDNVLMLGGKVSGLIDFYFACTDIAAYDLAVTHAAWSFSDETQEFDAATGRGLVEGYQSSRPLSEEELRALPLLARGACLRFMATRAFDWIDTPDTALVKRKDPMDFARRLQFYTDHGEEIFASGAKGLSASA